MRLLLQRVSEARVEVDGEITGQVEKGLLLLAGFAKGDTQADIDTLVKKTIHMRIFENEQGKFDRSVLDIGGGMLVVSQFTLYADTRKGRRPSFHL
ncbi:MAG TPA: D-tyrosyl-tRNA(Tyr) deacylase, partial [Myxococcales bacterium]|nr:D-tyrosyl-tRNA(Tyr) deacylase [Myxococcales bacterium]